MEKHIPAPHLNITTMHAKLYRPHLAHTWGLRRLPGYDKINSNKVLGDGKSPVGAYKRVEALQFLVFFKTILIVSFKG